MFYFSLCTHDVLRICNGKEEKYKWGDRARIKTT